MNRPRHGLGRQLAAEALGTGVLVLFGCAAAVLSGDLLAIAATFGLTLALLVHLFGPLTGGHFNPAVSIAAAAGGRIGWVHAALYAAAQVLGAIGGALVLFLLLQGLPGFEYGDPVGTNAYGDAGSGLAFWAAFLTELLLTSVLVGVVLTVTDRRAWRTSGIPWVIGAVYAGIHMVSVPLTGTSVNPARSIGPALFAGDWVFVGQLWLFVLAPLIGAVLVALAYNSVLGAGQDPVPGSGLRLPRAAAAPAGASYPRTADDTGPGHQLSGREQPEADSG